jgi:hypothetical protein
MNMEKNRLSMGRYVKSKWMSLLCGLLLLYCEDLRAISYLLDVPLTNFVGTRYEHLVRYLLTSSQDSIFLTREEILGLADGSMEMEEVATVVPGKMAESLVNAWSLEAEKMCKDIFNDLVRLGFGSYPDHSVIIKCHMTTQFQEQCKLIPSLDSHKMVFADGLVQPGKEDIQGSTCVMKCYGSGVSFVDNYDGDSEQSGLRCRSLPWGIIKPLGFNATPSISVPITLDMASLPCAKKLMVSALNGEIAVNTKYFAIVGVYRADETYKAVINLYFETSPGLLHYISQDLNVSLMAAIIGYNGS